MSRQLLCRASAAGDTIVCTRGWRGLSVISSVNYHDPRHQRWREQVLKKAGYLCQECARYGRKTEATVAHHIKHADEYPELRYVVSNGRALCAACHNKEHPEKGGKWLEL